MPGKLRQNTAVTITIGQFINWADSKKPLYLELGGNDNFDPTKLICTLTKGSTQSTLTLTKTGGSNNINLLADSQVSFELTAGNVDTCGRLVLSFNNAVEGSEVILEGKTFEFEVMRADAYDALYGSGNMPVDVSAIATAVLASSGFTAGGTMNVATLLKSLAALAEGTWNLKAGTTNTWQVSDADDKDVVVLEIQLKTNANPYRDVSRI